ncbi:hypothetical protein MLD38_007927 [Melastoma candidum]|uniref:Uncharacterized protein n=1 Tax=Melastoma candidum TaxID=119954 RepID=A0ACB9S185_9MYRT|nr:hypothetical protein MLD38_007927 [Melastoma candidum]
MVTGQDQKMATLDLSLPQDQTAAKTVVNGVDGSLENAPSDTHRFSDIVLWQKIDMVTIILRLLCMASSVMALSFMVTAHEASNLILYGFQIPVQSKWSYSSSFQYLVGVSAAVAAHSLLQLLIFIPRLLRKSSVMPPESFLWLLFAADQVFAYILTSAGSAASGVTNVNRTGINHTPLPNFCKPLQGFCDHVTISIAFTFLGCISLAASAVLDVICLSKSID